MQYESASEKERMVSPITAGSTSDQDFKRNDVIRQARATLLGLLGIKLVCIKY
jgi:hypothetical protein